MIWTSNLPYTFRIMFITDNFKFNVLIRIRIKIEIINSI